jgi:hypothetical protein
MRSALEIQSRARLGIGLQRATIEGDKRNLTRVSPIPDVYLWSWQGIKMLFKVAIGQVTLGRTTIPWGTASTSRNEIRSAMSPCGRIAALRDMGYAHGHWGDLSVYSSAATSLGLRKGITWDNFLFDGEFVIAERYGTINVISCVGEATATVVLENRPDSLKSSMVLVPDLGELWLTDPTRALWRYPWRLTARSYSDHEIIRFAVTAGIALFAIGTGILVLNRLAPRCKPESRIRRIPFVQDRLAAMAGFVMCLAAMALIIQRNNLVVLL